MKSSIKLVLLANSIMFAAQAPSVAPRKVQAIPAKPAATAARQVPPAPGRKATYDGLWVGKNEAGRDVWVLVKGNSVLWMKAALDLPGKCYSFAGPKDVHKVMMWGKGQIREAAFTAEPESAVSAGFPSTTRVSGRFTPSGELEAEFLTRPAEPAKAPRGCEGPAGFKWTAHRATENEVLESFGVTRAEREEAGERSPKRPAADGVWIGTTSDQKSIRFVIKDNALAWMETDHEITFPATCFMNAGKQDIGFVLNMPLTVYGPVVNGEFSLREAPMILHSRRRTGFGYTFTGKMSGDAFSGELQASTQEKKAECDAPLNLTWSARKASLQEARPYLSLLDRVEMGESIPLLEEVQVGEVAGADCKTFKPSAKPYVFARGVREIAYRIRFNPEGAVFVQDWSAKVTGPAGAGTESTSCNDYAVVEGRPALSTSTTIVQRKDKGHFAPGSYKIQVFTGSGAPASITSFTVK